MGKPTATTEAGGAKVLILGDNTTPTPVAKTPVSVANPTSGGDQALYPSGFMGVATHSEGEILVNPGGFTTAASPVTVMAGSDGAGSPAASIPHVKTAAPGAGDKGLVTRNIPSGTQTVAATDLDIRDLSSVQDSVSAVQSGSWTLSANSGVDIGDVTINNAAGASAVNIQDGGNSITVDGTIAATKSGIWTLDANSGVDIGDVTINNGAGVAAVNIQDGGNSITVDGTLAATQSGTWTVDANVTNAAGASAVNIQDGGNSITVDGTIAATQSGTWILGNNSGVDIGDVTVNNGAGVAAVNIQDGGNSLTVDGTIAATKSGTWTLDANDGVDIGDVTINNAGGASAVNIQDGGNSLTVDGTVSAAQSGTWNINNVSGTVSLPTGAATENSLTKIFVTPGAANDSNGVVPAAGNTTTSAPTYTTGQINALSLTTDGHLRVDGSAKTQPISASTLPLPTGAATSAKQDDQTTALQLIDDVPTALNGAFSKGSPIMGQLDDATTTAATENNCAPVRITAQRSLHVTLRDISGTATGTATNAVVVGARGNMTTPGPVTEGESVPIFADHIGRVVVVPISTPDKLTQNIITLTSTTETTLIAAGGVLLFRDMVFLSFTNTSATGTRLDIRDATGGTVRLSYWLAGGTSGVIPFPSVWKQTTSNNNWTAQLSAAVTDVRIMAQAVERQTPSF